MKSVFIALAMIVSFRTFADTETLRSLRPMETTLTIAGALETPVITDKCVLIERAADHSMRPALDIGTRFTFQGTEERSDGEFSFIFTHGGLFTGLRVLALECRKGTLKESTSFRRIERIFEGLIKLRN